ncbi:DUF1513 domain-containing protein [Octadecabacter sp.]|nr:DUF1513 domain-containing protein [Octadecabacter sp.]
MPHTGRRQFLRGLLATGLAPTATWANAGSPVFISAAVLANGDAVLCGLDADLELTFRLPLPARGHAAAGHPTRPEAVAFARRPGTFAIVIDCITGQQIATLSAPEGRHFYGHGTFSADGATLYTTENDYDAGRGCMGLWDASNGYRRVGEWDSGGIGPHDIKRMPGSDILVVANGGIDTHPDTGRVKLNIPSMRPNIAYLHNADVVERAYLSGDLHKNSIRHLAVSDAGLVAFAMQWEGDGTPTALVGTHRMGSDTNLLYAPREDLRGMEGYIGSIAVSPDGTTIAVTSPRGNAVQRFDAETGMLIDTHVIADASGIAAADDEFVITSGTGNLIRLRRHGTAQTRQASPRFDNHLVSLQ